MPHSAALYTVRVKVKGRGHDDDFRPLGDFDEEGTWLGDVLAGYLEALSIKTEDELRELSNRKVELYPDDEQVFAILKNGQRGTSADLEGEDGEVEFHQRPPHLHSVKTGVLFTLPRSESVGWLAIHVNNGRGAKSLLCNELQGWFRADYPGLLLRVEASQVGSAFAEAVRTGTLDKIKLLRYDHPTDRARRAASGKWVSRDVTARVELDVSGSRGFRLNPRLIRRLMRGDDTAFGEILEFGGMRFDQAKVEAEVPGGRTRTFNLERPEAGHPLTQELEDLEYTRAGDPTDDSLYQALDDVVTSSTA